MIHKIVSLRKPIKVVILETGVKGEYELHIQHETGVENLSGLSVEDMSVLYQTIDHFLDDGAGGVELTDGEQSAILNGEDGEMSDSDLLTNLMVDEVEALLHLYPDCETVDQAFLSYGAHRGFVSSSWSDEIYGQLAMSLQCGNPNLNYESSIEFAQKLQATTDNSLALEILRNALNHEDTE